jgi:hypothetical protein
MNAPALGDNFAAVSDFFSNKPGGIQLLQGDANLSQIDDVLHHVDTFGVGSPVPLELIGYGRNLNRDVLEQKKEQYDEAVGSVRGWLVAEFILPILERQWLMLGIWPDALEVDVQWKAKKEATPLELKDMAAFATAVKAASILTDPTLLRILATRLPDFDVDAEIAALESEAAEREAADRLEMQRMAVNAQMAPQDGEDGEDADQEAQP